ncbi:hypothetical protein EON81_13385 [bacterium]|nr:MAG: hypothetical protein EON81_13385 [bacterium]
MCIAGAVIWIALFGYFAVQMGPGMFFMLLLVEGDWTLILLEAMLALAFGLFGVAVTVGIRNTLRARSKLRD